MTVWTSSFIQIVSLHQKTHSPGSKITNQGCFFSSFNENSRKLSFSLFSRKQEDPEQR